MRNSSLVEWFCAENLTGLKRIPKLGLDSSEQSLPKRKGNSREAGKLTQKEKVEGFVQESQG